MRLFTILLTAALVVTCSPSTAPDEPAPADTVSGEAPTGSVEDPAEAQAAASSTAGMRIRVDPETGRRLPLTSDAAAQTRSDLDLLAQRMAGGDGEPSEEPVPGGGVLVRSGGRIFSATRATLQPDGSLAIECSPKAADPDSESEEVDR